MMNKPYPVHYDIDHDATIYRAPGLNVREAVMPNEEDSGYSVYVAEDLDNEEALKALKHALGHIDDCDFQKADVQQIESDQHDASSVHTEVENQKKKEREERHRKRMELFDKQLAARRRRLAKKFEDVENFDINDWITARIERDRLDPDK